MGDLKACYATQSLKNQVSARLTRTFRVLAKRSRVWRVGRRQPQLHPRLTLAALSNVAGREQLIRAKEGIYCFFPDRG